MMYLCLGHRGYFLKGVGVKLNFAVIQFGLDLLYKKGYTLLQTPFFMKKDVMAKTAQLEDFDDQLYKVTLFHIHILDIHSFIHLLMHSIKVVGGAKDEEHEKYLIATSEQPISAFHMDETLDPKLLPLRYAG